MQCFERPLAIKVFARDVIHLWWYPRKRWKSQWKSMSSKKLFQSHGQVFPVGYSLMMFRLYFPVVSHFSIWLWGGLENPPRISPSLAPRRTRRPSKSPTWDHGHRRCFGWGKLECSNSWQGLCRFFLWGNMEEIHTCVYCILHTCCILWYTIQPYSIYYIGRALHADKSATPWYYRY